MKTKNWREVRAQRMTPEREERVRKMVEAEVLEMNLASCRELAGMKQVEVAAAMEMNQGPLSDFERRDDHLVSKLRRYVEALGGELEVVARFDNKTVRLVGV